MKKIFCCALFVSVCCQGDALGEEIKYHHKYVPPKVSEVFNAKGPQLWLHRNVKKQLGKEKADALMIELENRSLYEEISIREMVHMVFNFKFQKEMNRTMNALVKRDPIDKMIFEACETLEKYKYMKQKEKEEKCHLKIK